MPYRKRKFQTPGHVSPGIRYELACSQAEMALYLGIDRGRLAMIEAGTREMPRSTRMLKTELELHLAKAPAGANSKSPIIEKQEEELRLYLAKEIKDLKFFITTHERKLAAIEKQYDLLYNAIKKLSGIQFGPNDLNYPANQEWVDLMLKIREVDIHKYSLAKQMAIKQKLAGLRAEKTYCEELLAFYNGKE
jgi:transcriptional regulator with XRE-family HTH domain